MGNYLPMNICYALISCRYNSFFKQLEQLQLQPIMQLMALRRPSQYNIIWQMYSILCQYTE